MPLFVFIVSAFGASSHQNFPGRKLMPIPFKVICGLHLFLREAEVTKQQRKDESGEKCQPRDVD